MTDFIPKPIFSKQNSQSANGASGSLDGGKDDDTPTTEIKTHNQYRTNGLDESNLSPSALTQFHKWFQEALDHPQIPEPESMTVSTVAISSDGKTPPRPSSRVVLLKKLDQRGFLFYSNYESRKGREIAANPWIALTFYWYPLHRSVRVCGRVEKLTKEENHTYFNSRPVGSRIGAISSPQSQVIQGRKELEDIVKKNERRYDAVGSAGLDGEEAVEQEGKEIPVPDYWGGFRVVPDEVEFWMGRSNRLHDRFR
jgi:pyridoxamine 5'-phosphate oxidase